MTGSTPGTWWTAPPRTSSAATCGTNREIRCTSSPPHPHWWERRTAIVATWFFIRQDDLDDTFRLADILADDPADLVQKAVGGWVREAGKRDPIRLGAYLDRHAATMPRTTLRYAVEHLSPELRSHYLGMKGTQSRVARP